MQGESRALIFALALRALRWRAAASATVFVVAVIAVLAATVGPIYLHAVDEAVLASHLKRATDFQRSVLITRSSTVRFPHVNWTAQIQALATEVSHDRLFARPVWERQIDVTYGGSPPTFKSEIATIDDLCAHVRVVRGRCLSGDTADQTLISENTAQSQHVGVGGTLATTAPNGLVIRLHVVGVYRPLAPASSYWQPWGFFGFGELPGFNSLPPGDASFVTPATLASRLQRTPETQSANLGLRPEAVRYNDIGELRRTLTRVRATVAHLVYRAGATGVPAASVTTVLPTILDATTHETSVASTLVTVATAQLALLAIFLLYLVVANTTSAQGPEVALAKLRGRRTASVLLQSILQPVALVVAAAPLGALLAWVVVRLLASSLLGHHVEVTFPAAAFGVAALAVVGGALAAVVAARRIVVTPVGALMRRGAALPGSAVGLMLADAAAVTLAVAGIIELEAGGVLNSGRPNPLSMLAPTLLAVAAGVVALRLLPLPARALVRWTRDSRRLATFLAVRHLVRRPAEARAVLPVAVALSIAAFAITNWSDARHNRSLRALNAAGASTVLIVRPGAGVDDLRAAVDRADPTGQSMAVAYTKLDGGVPPLLAVDTARFPSVGAWVRGNTSAPLGSVLRRLAGGRSAPVTVGGSQLRLRIDLTRHPKRAVSLAVTFTKPDHERAVRRAGPIVPGTKSYVLPLPKACAGGCEIARLSLSSNTVLNNYGLNLSDIDAVIGASVRNGDRWQPVASFADAARWRTDSSGPAAFRTVGGSLSVQLRQVPGTNIWPAAISAAIPTAVPAVVPDALAASYERDQNHDVPTVGLDGQSLTTDGVIRSVTLPRVDRSGIMVDLGTALAAMSTPPARSTQYQVWLSASAPANMAARLARLHVYVRRTIHASSFRPALDDSGPAFADSLFLIAALAATVLATGATAVGRVASVRRRSYELAALEAVGISPGTLRRAMAAEVGTVFTIGLIVGLAAGLFGSWLALPSTPVFVDTSTGPPLVFGLPWAGLVVLTLGLVVVFIVVSVAIARLVERAAGPGQLRGAQQ